MTTGLGSVEEQAFEEGKSHSIDDRAVSAYKEGLLFCSPCGPVIPTSGSIPLSPSGDGVGDVWVCGCVGEAQPEIQKHNGGRCLRPINNNNDKIPPSPWSDLGYREAGTL